MAKRRKIAKIDDSHDDTEDIKSVPSNVVSVASSSVDPSLVALFQSSAKPVNAFQRKQSYDSGKHVLETSQPGSDSQLLEPSSTHQKKAVDNVEAEPHQTLSETKARKHRALSRKRARNDEQDDLEVSYLNRLAREEAKEDRQQENDAPRKRQKSKVGHTDAHGMSPDQVASSVVGSDIESESAKEDAPEDECDEKAVMTQGDSDQPQTIEHESVSGPTGDTDLEKASRTVFVGNICTSTIKSKAAKSTLMQHLISCVAPLPSREPAHKIESLRFRSIPFSTSAIPKKAAFVKKELMDATTKSTNAYVVYSTSLAAREAVKKLNGSLCLDRHIRVDSVAHPSKTDHKRCVFVGNLGFVNNPEAIDAAEDEENQKKPRKPREPADIEEGLWRIFGRSGKVESVRVIRDPITRVGKGFAYVQFEDANVVEKALLFAGKKFPPMLPRILRVTRAKNIDKTASGSREPKGAAKPSRSANNAIHISKPNPQQQSLSGRAGKLFGRAGAAKLRSTGSNSITLGERRSKISVVNNKASASKPVIFEGYRASSAGKKGVKVVPKKGKPQNRSSKRAAAFRVGGSKTKREKVREQ